MKNKNRTTNNYMVPHVFNINFILSRTKPRAKREEKVLIEVYK